MEHTYSVDIGSLCKYKQNGGQRIGNPSLQLGRCGARHFKTREVEWSTHSQWRLVLFANTSKMEDNALPTLPFSSVDATLDIFTREKSSGAHRVNGDRFSLQIQAKRRTTVRILPRHPDDTWPITEPKTEKTHRGRNHSYTSWTYS